MPDESRVLQLGWSGVQVLGKEEGGGWEAEGGSDEEMRS